MKFVNVHCPVKGCESFIKVIENSSILEYTVCRDEMERHLFREHCFQDFLDVLWKSITQNIEEEEK